MPDAAQTAGADTFAGLVAAAVFVVESSRRPREERAAPPDPAALARLRRGQGGIDDLDAWREAYGWDVRVLLDVLARVLGILDMLAPGEVRSGVFDSLLADSTPGADAAFPRVLRRSAYLPLVETPEAERVLAWARVVGRALALAQPPPLSLRVTGLASDLSMVADDLEEVAKELRTAEAVVLGGQVVQQRRLLARAVDALDGVATELKEGRLQ
jgi:hypothetical protein